MKPLVSLLLKLAHAVAPKGDKLWINDMRLEASFVPNKLSFAFAALGLAFKFRFAALRFNRPVGIAFASAALAALATFLVVPRLFVEDTTTAAMSPVPNANYESVQDLAQERGVSVAAQDALDAGMAAPEAEAQAATQPTTAETTEPDTLTATTETTTIQEGAFGEQMARVSPDAEVPAESTDAAVAEAPPAAITPPEPLAQEPASQTPAPAITTNPDAEATEPPAATSPVDIAEEASNNDTLSLTLPAETAPEPQEASAATEQRAKAVLPEPATPSVDTDVISSQVRGESVTIEVVADALLTLYRDTNFSGSPRAHRFVTPGESFIANVPFSLYTNNAAAIKVTIDGESYNLGEANEEQFRIFSKP